MEKSIAQYQKTFGIIMNTLKQNPKVLAILVSGSIVNGDLWDESDIDIMIICSADKKSIKNLYSEEEEIPVHIKVMEKNQFIRAYESNVKGSKFHRNLSVSRLMFSKDDIITNIYNGGRYCPDSYRERWSMYYLGILLKTMGVARKYLYNRGFYTAYSVTIRALDEFAKFYVNLSGYNISVDALIMATNLDDNFKNVVENVLNGKFDDCELICETLNYIEKRVEELLKESTEFILEFIRDENKALSVDEVKNHPIFKDFDIDMEEILKLLCKKGFVRKMRRDYNTDDGSLLVKENVYYV